MGFYGNITNTSRTQFQFDKVYFNRAQMDDAAETDGIYTGRYVLVNYDTEGSNDYYISAYKTMGSSGFEFGSTLDGEQLTRFKWTASASQVTNSDRDTVYTDQTIIIPPDHIHNQVNLDATKYEYWRCTGHVTIDGVNYATFSQYENSYADNYNIDVERYGTSRGYDSTVWQKIYQNGHDKYVMIAELNTIVPTFDIEADAPRMVPLLPHFDASSTNIYYKLHWAPTWGFRVKAANPELKGPLLNDNGTDVGNRAVTILTSDPTVYPSDETTTWYKSVEQSDHSVKDYVFTVDGAGTTGKWIPKNIEERNNVIYNGILQKELVAGAPAAIYYNKDGFDPEHVAYSYFEADINDQAEYENGTYYKKVQGKYVLANDLQWDPTEPYYEKVEDHILLQPTGYSGHMYNKHDGSITDSLQEDMQELSIMLPTIGDTIAAVWDLMYGGESVNDGIRRNLDVSWERARVGMDRHGLRLVTDFDAGGHYLYKTKNVDTVAGAINSVHDLMGMIITSESRDNLLNNIDALDENRIYYNETDRTFNRKTKQYTYTELVNTSDNYTFIEVSLVGPGEEFDDDTYGEYKVGTYYIKRNNDYLVSNDAFDSSEIYYMRFLDGGAEYEPVPVNTIEEFDGTLYAYQDFIGADENSYQYIDITSTINSNNYEPNVYYIDVFKSDPITRDFIYILDTSNDYDVYKHYYEGIGEEDNITDYHDVTIDINNTNYIPNTYYITVPTGIYILDNDGHYDAHKRYYKRTSLVAEDKMDYIRSNKYYKDRIYFLWNDIHTTQYDQLSDSYDKNKFYYVNGQGDYILATSDTPLTGEQYYTFIPENLRSVKSLFGPNQAYGIYVPGKYLYRAYDPQDPTIFDYKLAVAPTLSAMQYANPSGVYYTLSTTSSQQTINDAVYTLVESYDVIDLFADGQNNYMPGVYYYKPSGSTEYILCEDLQYDPSKAPYYVKNESLIRVRNNYYKAEERYEYSLIQFSENTFYQKVKNDFKLITKLADTATLTGDNIYVLRKEPNSAGRYDLFPSDFTNPDVSAMIKQTQFYEPGIYHYLYKDSNSDIYTDYILDNYPTKQHGTNYYKIDSIGNPVDLSQRTFFAPYEFYNFNASTGEYTVITDMRQLPQSGNVYKRNQVYYVLNDEANIYTKGAVWSFENACVPASLTLATRTEQYGLEPFEDFARTVNTMHGMILKVKSMLDYANKDARDITTVQGALNLLGDRLAQFATWSPKQIMIVDDYGRLHGADIETDQYITVNVDSNIDHPKVVIGYRNTEEFPRLTVDPIEGLTNNSNILTALNYNSDTGTISIGNTIPINLLLTGYTKTIYSPEEIVNITSTNTLGQALDLLENKLDYLDQKIEETSQYAYVTVESDESSRLAKQNFWTEFVDNHDGLNIVREENELGQGTYYVIMSFSDFLNSSTSLMEYTTHEQFENYDIYGNVCRSISDYTLINQ